MYQIEDTNETLYSAITRFLDIEGTHVDLNTFNVKVYCNELMEFWFTLEEFKQAVYTQQLCKKYIVLETYYSHALSKTTAIIFDCKKVL